jgi:hypothetical protein
VCFGTRNLNVFFDERISSREISHYSDGQVIGVTINANDQPAVCLVLNGIVCARGTGSRTAFKVVICPCKTCCAISMGFLSLPI